MTLRRTIRRFGRISLVIALVAAASPALAADAPVEAAAARAARAGVSEAIVERLLARGAERRLPADAQVAALSLVEGAASRGLPVEGVADKILEGLAKGVPPARLLPVVEGMVARLREADESLAALPASSGARPALIEAGAEALRRGASPVALAALAAEVEGSPAPSDQLEVAIRTLGDLGEQGVAEPMAGVVLGRMVARGYAAGAVRGVAAQVAAALEEGAPADLVFEEMAARAEGGRPMDRLVDPFSERPGEVVRDPAARSKEPKLPAARGKGLENHPLGGPPGQTGMNRPGVPTAPGQRKKLENAGKGNNDKSPGKGQGNNNGKGQTPKTPPGQGKGKGPNR